MKNVFKYNIGDKVYDIITGFEGVVAGQHRWITGCNTYSVQPMELKDGRPQDRVALDEPQLGLVERKSVPVPEQKVRTGGPRDEHGNPVAP